MCDVAERLGTSVTPIFHAISETCPVNYERRERVLVDHESFTACRSEIPGPAGLEPDAAPGQDTT